MPKIAVNLHDVKELEALHPGQYPVMIESITETKSKEKQKEMCKIKFKCTGEGLHNVLFTNIMLDENSMWKWKQLYEAANISYDESGFDTDDLIGAELIVTVDIEMYNGKPQNKVGDFLKA